jgi:hypothetical protein
MFSACNCGHWLRNDILVFLTVSRHLGRQGETYLAPGVFWHALHILAFVLIPQGNFLL